MPIKKFDILPNVTKEDRDLRFRPVDNSVLDILSAEQITHYNKQD